MRERCAFLLGKRGSERDGGRELVEGMKWSCGRFVCVFVFIVQSRS